MKDSTIIKFPPLPKDLKERMREAFPTERIQKLGPNQRKLLKAKLNTSQTELTVPVLQGMLEDIEDQFPEVVIPLLPSLQALLKHG